MGIASGISIDRHLVPWPDMQALLERSSSRLFPQIICKQDVPAAVAVIPERFNSPLHHDRNPSRPLLEPRLVRASTGAVLRSNAGKETCPHALNTARRMRRPDRAYRFAILDREAEDGQ